MRKLVAGSIALIVVFAAGVCNAQAVVKQEPMEGTLLTGATSWSMTAAAELARSS